jgi:hypothetical protein
MANNIVDTSVRPHVAALWRRLHLVCLQFRAAHPEVRNADFHEAAKRLQSGLRLREWFPRGPDAEGIADLRAVIEADGYGGE